MQKTVAAKVVHEDAKIDAANAKAELEENERIAAELKASSEALDQERLAVE